MLDYASVEEAMRGQEAVICALGHTKFFSPSRILSEGTRNLPYAPWKLKASDA